MEVPAGAEENIRKQYQAVIAPDILKKCIVPYFEEKKKFQGQWRILKKKLFPGYLLIETEDIDRFRKEIRQAEGAEFDSIKDLTIVPLTEEDQNFLNRIVDENSLMSMSEGVIIRKRTIVRKGPLQGMERFIRKIDRHKRKAWLEMELFGKRQRIEVGLEITEKML